MLSYPRPRTFEEFERLCLEYLRSEWQRPGLALYGKRGYEQYGVDIVDTGPGECWAAQCKLHEDGKALQAAEVLAEVLKADAFPQPIHRYAVCTTGKKTPHTQDSVSKLNKQRAADGKFPVELVYWDDIELKLEQDDEFRERHSGSTHASVRTIVNSELNQALGRGLGPIKAQLHDLLIGAHASDANAFDSDLDRAKRLLDANQNKGAEALLRDLKDTKYDRLTALQRFRCLSNLGVIEYQNGNDAEAARLMLKAAEEYPAHEKAASNRAHAHNLLGNHGEAWSAIEAARIARPHDTHVMAAYVAYAPADRGFEVLAELVGEGISDSEVLTAFADRCLQADDYAGALRFIEGVKGTGKETADSLFIEGRAIAFPHLPDDPREAVEDAVAYRAIDAGLALLDRAAHSAEQGGDVRSALSIRLAHAHMSGCLKDNNRTEGSLEEAARLTVGFTRGLAGVNIMRSQLALAQGRYERAMDYAAQALKNAYTLDAKMLHAVALLNRNEGADRENARRELRRILPGLKGPYLEQALNIMVTDLLAQHRFDAALDAMRVAAASDLDRACSLAQEARVALAKNENERAAPLAKEAASALNVSSTAATRRMVAAFLRQVEDLGTAVETLRPLASRSTLTTDTKTFLAVAMDAKRDDLVIEWCKELWEHKALNASARWNYLHLLEKYDPQAALQKTTIALAEESDPQELGALKARRAFLERRLGRAVTNVLVTDVPPVQSVYAHYVVLFVEAMLLAGLHPDAVEFAYRSVLRFPDEPGAHAALIRCFLFPRDREHPLISAPSEVATGVAIEIQEGDSHPTWHTIEEDYVAGLPDVVPTSKAWVSRLVGKRVGDVVVLAEGSAGSRTVVVKTIEAASVHRYRDSLHTWQLRFPEHPLLEEHQLKTDPATGEFDFAPIVEMLKAQVDNVKRVDEIYRRGILPMSLIAERSGRQLFETMDHLSRHGDLFVNCVYATEPIFREAIALLDGAKGLVLDGTALWTIRELGVVDVLQCLPLPFGTVQQSFDALQRASDSRVDGVDGGVLSLEDGRLALRELPADIRQGYRASWNEVGSALTKGRVLSSEALALMPSDQREQLISVTGDWAAHAIAAAKQHGFVLWSDDRVLEFLAKEFFGVTRVWTQAVLHWLRSRNVLDDVRWQQASAKLQARRYTGTLLDAGVLVQAAKLADWKLNSAMYERNARVLSDATTDPRACLTMAIALIAACMTDVRLTAMQVAIVTSILEQVKTRDRSLRIARHVLHGIPGALRLNPLAANQAIQIVRAWLHTNQPVIVKIAR